MAEDLNRFSLAPCGLVVGALLLWSGAAQGAAEGTLPDPTRPALPGPAEAARTGGAKPGDAPGLRSVVTRGPWRGAVIGGELVPVGGKVGEATLLAVHEDHVVLRHADGRRETLSLYPAVEVERAGRRLPRTPQIGGGA